MSTDIVLALIIFVATYAFIVTEKIPPAAAAILGGSLVVFLQLIPHEAALEKVDVDVVFLLAGMMLVVNVLSETGFFEWVAVTIAQRSRGHGMVILIGLITATAVLSAFLDNVTTVVLIIPITILITQILEIRPEPFLILEALFSNVGGTATLIGDPPNILIGAKSGLTFNQFILNLGPLVLVVLGLTSVIVYVIFRKSMTVTPEARKRIMMAHPSRAITDPRRLTIALPLFFLILLGFTLSHSLGVQPGLVALVGGFAMVVFTGSSLRRAFEKVEWETIFFLIGLFILVGALEYNNLFDRLGEGLVTLTQGSTLMAALAILWLAGVLAALLGAVPVAISLIPLVSAYVERMASEGAAAGAAAGGPPGEVLWWALALGACLGGNGTMLGTAANVVVIQVARKNRYHISFFEFARYGVPIMLFSLVLSSVYLYLRYFLLTG
ncbi:MAG: SLC13 family permease [Candidatus Hydrogenedentota bacterium]